MAKKKIKNIFTDWGVLDYFSYFFRYNSQVKRTIDLAGYAVSIEELNKEISKMDNVTTSTKGQSKEEQDTDIKYNKLVQELNQSKSSVRFNTKAMWNNTEKKVLKYFNTGMNIYEDRGDVANIRIKGYYLNTSNDPKEHGKLRYCDGKNYIAICQFKNEEMLDVKLLFPSLFPDNRLFPNVFQPRTKLKPQKFIQLITLAQKSDPKVEFHLPASRVFINLINALKERIGLVKKQEKQKDPRGLDEIVDDTTKCIMDELGEFRKKHPRDKTNAKYLLSKHEMINAIEQYLKDGDVKNLAVAVAKYDKSYFKGYFEDGADRAIALIKKLKGNGTESEFFNIGIKHWATKRENDNSVYKFDSLNKNDDAQKNKVIEDWNSHLVTKNVYKNCLAKLQSTLDSVNMSDFPYIEIQQSENVAALKFDNNVEKNVSSFNLQNAPSINSEVIEGELEDDLVGATETNKSQTKVIIERIPGIRTTVIEQLKNVIGGYNTLLAYANENENYQSQCATIQNEINRILTNKREVYDSGKEINETYLSKQYELGDTLTKLLQQAKKPKQQVAEIKCDVAALKSEIDRLIYENNKLQIKLETYRDEVSSLSQSTRSNKISDFLDVDLKKTQNHLTELRDILKNTRNQNVVIIDKSTDEPHNTLNTVNVSLNELKSKLTDKLKSILLNRETGDKDPTNDCEIGYFELNAIDNEKCLKKFSELNKNLQNELPLITDLLTVRSDSYWILVPEKKVAQKLGFFGNNAIDANLNAMHNARLGDSGKSNKTFTEDNSNESNDGLIIDNKS